MRIVLQRVSEAAVSVDGTERGRIKRELLVLLGVQPEDNAEDIDWLANKVIQLRIFDDQAGVMNRSVQDIAGGILLISQFTLLASTKKGTRPSWHRAAKPEIAVPLYEAFHRKLEELLGRAVASSPSKNGCF